MRIPRTLPFLLSFILLPMTQAHHGWTEFDLDREVTMDGKVIDFHFVNPHCVLEFEVNRSGQVRKWQGEFAGRVQLTARGWTAASLQPGDMVAVTGHPGKNDIAAMYVVSIRMPNGRELPVDGK